MTDPRFHTQRDPRPWPVSALARRLGITDTDRQTTSRLALRLGIDRRNVMRYRQWGLTTRQADEWAHRAGLHPREIWPHWDALHLAGRALINAAREQCPEGHRYDGVDRRGYRICRTCKRQIVRRIRANTQVRPLATSDLQEAM